MRNRAKCKLCNEILESFHKYDYVTCKCGQISVSGGSDYFECGAKNWENFIRIDDADHEIAITLIDKIIDKEVKEDHDFLEKVTKEDRIDILRNMVKSYESLPQNALSSAVTGYDLYSVMLVILSILEDKK